MLREAEYTNDQQSCSQRLGVECCGQVKDNLSPLFCRQILKHDKNLLDAPRKTSPQNLRHDYIFMVAKDPRMRSCLQMVRRGTTASDHRVHIECAVRNRAW